MSSFIQGGLTNAGLALRAKNLAGAPITYTKIMMGDGTLPEGQMIEEITDMVSPVAAINISGCEKTGENQVTIWGIFTNEQLQQEFYYRELGLYAEDPDEGEILYSYQNAGDGGETIRPAGGSKIIEKTVRIITVVGRTANVTAKINSSLYVGFEAFDDLRARVDANENGVTSLNSWQVQQDEEIDALAAEVKVLKDASINNMTNNVFISTFDSLDEIELVEGIYDPVMKKIYA